MNLINLLDCPDHRLDMMNLLTVYKNKIYLFPGWVDLLRDESYGS